MFGKPKHKPEVARTCQRCGNQWYVLRSESSKRPDGRLVRWSERVTKPPFMEAGYERDQAYLTQICTCTQCGSRSFKDKPAPKLNRKPAKPELPPFPPIEGAPKGWH